METYLSQHPYLMNFAYFPALVPKSLTMSSTEAELNPKVCEVQRAYSVLAGEYEGRTIHFCEVHLEGIRVKWPEIGRCLPSWWVGGSLPIPKGEKK